MANTLGTYPLGEWIQNLKTRLKDFDDQNIPPGLWVSIINSVVGEFHELAELKDKAEYKDRVELTALAGNLGGVAVSEGGVQAPVGASYTDATKTLHVPAANFITGAFSANITNFLTGTNAHFINAEVVIRTLVSESPMFKTTIESISSITDVVLKEAYGSDIGSDNFLVITIVIPETADDINIGILGIYKYIDQITMINDSVRGTCEAVTEAKFRSIANPVYANPNYKTKIIYFRDGEYLRFAKGSSVTTYGTRTMYFTRTPYKSDIDVLTDFVDVKDTNKKLIEDLCLLSGFQTLKVPIPSELKTAETKLDKMRARKESEIAKLVADSPS